MTNMDRQDGQDEIQKTKIGDWCSLYRADSTKILDVLRQEQPKAILTDPPYGLGLHRAGIGRSEKTGMSSNIKSLPSIKRRNSRIVGDHPKEKVDLSPWFDFTPEILLFGAAHLRDQLPAGGRFLEWDKLAGKKPWDSYSDIEFTWHSRGGKSTIFPFLWKGIITSKLGEHKGHLRRIHPQQKPVPLMSWCLDQMDITPESGVVLDPFLGSGSTAIAAFRWGYQFIGVEIDPVWYLSAVRRIKAETERVPLKP